jgi:hypothetical protein
MAQPSKSIPAIRKLELSQIDPAAVQRELMGEDVGIQAFMLYFSSKIQFDVSDRIVDATIDRSIEASSALTVVINDYDRAVLSSGQLTNKLDVQVDGLWFRLAGLDKSGDELTLTFEDREIAVLREYTKWKKVNRTNATRAEFVLNLIREVKEFHIPVVIPELRTIQPEERFPGDLIGTDKFINKQMGINVAAFNAKSGHLTPAQKSQIPAWAQTYYKNFIPTAGLTVKGVPITDDQKTNAGIIIGVGKRLGATRKCIVTAVATAIQESTLQNIDYGDKAGPDSRGLFQQRSSWGSLVDRMNPETSSAMFYGSPGHAIQYDIDHPGIPDWELSYNVQHCAAQDKYLPQQWVPEANNLVNAYGMVAADKSGNTEGLASLANGMFTGVSNAINSGLGIQTPGVSTNGGAYYFFRGNIVGRGNKRVRLAENSWSCIQRLAGEVNFSAFFVSGTFYWISEDLLLKQQPQYNLTEFMDGIMGIDGSYKHLSKAAQLTVTADVGRWMAPPGTCVVIQNMGPWNGRWIVTEYSRSLFDLQATITLKKPRPVLPEPLTGNESELKTWLPVSGPPVVNPHSGKPIDPNIGIATGDLPEIANQLYKMNLLGKYHADNPGDLTDITATMRGQKVNSQCGGQVTMDTRVFQIILWLIGNGYRIGTFAFCSDHHCDSMTGHAGGHAVDISSINGISINQNTPQAKNLVLQIDDLLHHTPSELAPRQLITAGYGNHRDPQCLAYCIPNNPETYYGEATLNEHCNHIHVGY